MSLPSRRHRRLLLALLPLLLAGCRGSGQARREEVVPPFVFRSLDLRQQTPLGQPSWELTSPEARYDLRRRLAQASRPKGVIYSGGKPLYRLQADSGTVVGDGEAILLEGNLRMQRLGSQPVLILASRARWLPRRQLLLIDRDPQALDTHGRLRAERARFLLQDDRLELSGKPRLERWEQRFNPFTAPPTTAAPITVEASQVSWKPGSGDLRASGPLQARRRIPGMRASVPPQTLSAASLEGNTLVQTYTLQGSVQFLDAATGDRFSGQNVSLLPGSQEASTPDPFDAGRGDLQVSGSGLRVEGRDQWVRVASRCRLQRPGETLEAERCAWNWKTGAVQASGGVLLQRSVNAQVTRGEALSGELGAAGSVLVTAPGARVVSRFRPPANRPAAPPPPRPAPDPIVP